MDSSEVCVGSDSLPLDELLENLSSSSRRLRQQAAASLSKLSSEDPECILPYGDVLIDALKRPEARTRWEVLDALANLVPLNPQLCAGALELSEESLFDETNGTVRLAAMRFICGLGAASEEMAAETWPLIDEALQCYHGDPEYIDMLIAVNDFAQAKLPQEVVDGLVERMKFDAANPKSGLVKRANSIIDAATRQ